MRVKEMPVRNLRDVVSLVNQNVDIFAKKLCKLQKTNRQLKILAGIALVCAVASELKRSQLEEELYRLNVRLKKLERREEE